MPSHEIKKEREERKKKNGKGNEGRKERGGREMIKKKKKHMASLPVPFYVSKLVPKLSHTL